MKTLFIASLMLLVGAGCTSTVPYTSPTDSSAETSTSTSSLRMNLSREGLTEFPMSVFTQKNIVELNISHNALRGAMPSQINVLKKLQSLDASHNQMTGVPAEIGQLPALEILNLSDNQLTGLPYELGNLSNLKILNLRGNHVSQADLDIIRKSLPASTQILVDESR